VADRRHRTIPATTPIPPSYAVMMVIASLHNLPDNGLIEGRPKAPYSHFLDEVTL